MYCLMKKTCKIKITTTQLYSDLIPINKGYTTRNRPREKAYSNYLRTQSTNKGNNTFPLFGSYDVSERQLK